MNPFFLIGAVADLLAVAVHGVVGHRLILARLTNDHLFSTAAFGDAAATRRVIIVSWHAVTAAFLASAAMMFLLAFGAVTSRPAALFVSALHAGFLAVGFAAGSSRIIGLIKRPRLIPVGFFTVMTTVVVMGWLGSR
ncbi:MAG TPA: hypothetical protein VG602_02580 [Actinomycetota bacterium]|nr:hypothetical protein [Actinomycetota bacterium]